MEEPAWLNTANLRAKPKYTKAPKVKGETLRQVLAHTPLRDVHDWLYDVAYDRAAFEIHSESFNLPVSAKSGDSGPTLRRCRCSWATAVTQPTLITSHYKS